MRLLLSLFLLVGFFVSSVKAEGLKCEDIQLLMNTLYSYHPSIVSETPLDDSVYTEQNIKISLEFFISKMDPYRLTYIEGKGWEELIYYWRLAFYEAAMKKDCKNLESFYTAVLNYITKQKKELHHLDSFNGVTVSYAELIQEVKSLKKKISSFSSEERASYYAQYKGFPENVKEQEHKIKLAILKNWNNISGKDPLASEDEEFAFAMKMVLSMYALPLEVNDGGKSAAVQAVYSSYDRHTTYFTKDEYVRYSNMFSANLIGIGAGLSLVSKGFLIEHLDPGSALEKSGVLKKGDIIFKIKDENGEYTFIDHLNENPGHRFTGKKGSKLELFALRNGAVIKDTILRDYIGQNSDPDNSKYSKIYYTDKGKKIGVVVISLFVTGNERSTTSRLKSALEGFRRAGVDGVIIDLRNNIGGIVSEAHSSMSLLMSNEDPKKGVIVKGKNGVKVEEINPKAENFLYKGPLVILVNELSASSSEIMAGTLRAYNRAVIVGTEKTYGKGIIQHVISGSHKVFQVDGGFKITMSFYFLPNGEPVQGVGIGSDIVVGASTGGFGESVENKNIKTPKRIESLISEEMKSMSDKEFEHLVEGMQREGLIAVNGCRQSKEVDCLFVEKYGDNEVLKRAVNAFDGIK